MTTHHLVGRYTRGDSDCGDVYTRYSKEGEGVYSYGEGVDIRYYGGEGIYSYRGERTHRYRDPIISHSDIISEMLLMSSSISYILYSYVDYYVL